MWHSMMHMDISVWEKAIRTAAVYGVLLLLLRLWGRRDLAQVSTFDLVVMLLLSNVVQNAIIGPDNSLLGGTLGAVILVLVNAAVNRLNLVSTRASTLIEGSDSVLARDGEWDRRELRRLGLRESDVAGAIRRQGATGVQDCARVDLAASGGLVITLKPTAEPATADQVERLRAEVRALRDELRG